MRILEHRFAPLVVSAVAILGYVIANLGRLGAESYWTDELLSVGYANERFGEMLNRLATDWHPPGFNVITWFTIRLFGDASEALVRSISLVAIAVGIAVLATVVWRRIGPAAALVVLSLGLTSSLVASFAREARPHGLAFAMVCLTTAAWLIVLGSTTVRRRHLAAFATAGAIASFTSYYALLVYAIETAVILGRLAVGRRRGDAILVVVAFAVSLAPALYWIRRSWDALGSSSTPAFELAWAEEVAGYVADPFTSATTGADGIRHGIAIVIGALAIAMVLVVALLIQARRAGRPAPVRTSLGAASVLVAVLALVAAITESVMLAPSFHYRSVVSILPPLYVGLGAAATLPFGHRSAMAGVALSALLVAIAFATPEPTLPPSPKDDWRSVAVYVVEEVRDGLAAERVATVASPWGESVDWVLAYNLASERKAPAADMPADLRNVFWIYSAADVATMPRDGRMIFAAFHFWSWERHGAIVEAVLARFGPCQDLSPRGMTLLSCPPPAAASSFDGSPRYPSAMMSTAPRAAGE